MMLAEMHWLLHVACIEFISYTFCCGVFLELKHCSVHANPTSPLVRPKSVNTAVDAGVDFWCAGLTRRLWHRRSPRGNRAAQGRNSSNSMHQHTQQQASPRRVDSRACQRHMVWSPRERPDTRVHCGTRRHVARHVNQPSIARQGDPWLRRARDSQGCDDV